MQNRFENTVARICDLRLHAVRFSGTGRVHVTGITVQGRLAVPAPSFWKALARQFDWAERSVRDLDKDTLFQELLSEAPQREIEFGMTTDDDGNAFLTGPILDDFSADPDAEPIDWAGRERIGMSDTARFAATGRMNEVWPVDGQPQNPHLMSGPPYGPRPSRN